MLVAAPHEWENRAHETQYYMSWQISTYRKGRPIFSSLIGLGSLTASWRTKRKTTGPQTCERGFGLHWRIESLLEDSGESSPIPHAIMETIAHVPANHADQSLTLHELLVLSYMGEQHGRIIQASFDGEILVLQYSHLWSFEDADTAPVELFMRYNISQTVGLERSDACVRALAESVASMNL
ncbi:hypothetical protein N7536_004736 [Penicillium majusculum]|nr:hypothetical protein N7536_004736 [Penicillium majusculum]